MVHANFHTHSFTCRKLFIRNKKSLDHRKEQCPFHYVKKNKSETMTQFSDFRFPYNFLKNYYILSEIQVFCFCAIITNCWKFQLNPTIKFTFGISVKHPSTKKCLQYAKTTNQTIWTFWISKSLRMMWCDITVPFKYSKTSN